MLALLPCIGFRCPQLWLCLQASYSDLPRKRRLNAEPCLIVVAGHGVVNSRGLRPPQHAAKRQPRPGRASGAVGSRGRCSASLSASAFESFGITLIVVAIGGLLFPV